MSDSETRRALLRGSAVASARAAAALLTPPAIGSSDPDAELLALWAQRERLIEQHQAALEASETAGNQPFFDMIDECADRIMATPAAGFTGMLVKLRLGAAGCGDGLHPSTNALANAYAKTGQLDDDRTVISCWADAERLIGGARPVSPPASELDPDPIDLMCRRAAKLLARYYMIDEAISVASEAEKVEAEHALAEIYAIEEAIGHMAATRPAGAVHQLVTALGLTAALLETKSDPEEQDQRIEAIQRLLLSALRVLLPNAGLKPSDTLVENHTTEDEAAFLKGYASAA